MDIMELHTTLQPVTPSCLKAFASGTTALTGVEATSQWRDSIQGTPARTLGKP